MVSWQQWMLSEDCILRVAISEINKTEIKVQITTGSALKNTEIDKKGIKILLSVGGSGEIHLKNWLAFPKQRATPQVPLLY